MLLLRSLHDFPKIFSGHPNLDDAFVPYDDEDLVSWESQAKRWARVLFLVIKEEHHLTPILKVCFTFCGFQLILTVLFLILNFIFRSVVESTVIEILELFVCPLMENIITK